MDTPKPNSHSTNIAQGGPLRSPGNPSQLLLQHSRSLPANLRGSLPFLPQSHIPHDSVFGFGKDLPNPNSPRTDIEQGSSSRCPVDKTRYEPFVMAVRNGNLDATENFLKKNPEAVHSRITSYEETALHIATLFGHSHIVEKLVQLMSEEDLEKKNKDGHTALLIAAYSKKGNMMKAAKCMVEKNKRLLAITDSRDVIPVTSAFDFGNPKMGRYLYSVTPPELFLPQNGRYGAVLLTLCCYNKTFDIALHLVKLCPRLVMKNGVRGLNFLETVARMPYIFPSETQLPFWKRWLHRWDYDIEEVDINIPPETTEKRDDHVRGTSRGSTYKQYLELLRAACKVIPTLSEEEIAEGRIREAVLLAAKRGNAEFIVEAVKADLILVWSLLTADERILFFLAVQYRQEKVFNLIHGLAVWKNPLINRMDINGNSLLHMVGLPPPSTQLNRIAGALLQMQRELQWFKAVESILSPKMKESVNNFNLTARELFTENHKELVKQGEKWTKGTASSSSLVAALVATITFAAAFTVPGGNDQTKGYPIFLHRKLFMVFAISDAVSLFSSSTSLLMFLGLLTSRYAEDDFLNSLPKKLIIGLSTMFISIAAMMVAFCAALFLMLRDQYSWIVIPLNVLACVPITLYIWLQFPLLVEIFMSTYGPTIFHKNVKPWP